VLRTLGITTARPIAATPVDEELRRFDDHMDHVRGLAPRTRRAVLRIVREFLRWRFRDRPVVIPAIKPEHVRSCFVRLTERCHAPASMGAVVSALRGYFRYRATCGDTVYHLIGVLSYPANWQQASLPQTLGDEEVRRFGDCCIRWIARVRPCAVLQRSYGARLISAFAAARLPRSAWTTSIGAMAL
jgi:site-specific recombinase XerC